MKWTAPQYSRQDVNAAGKSIMSEDVVSLVETGEWDRAVEVINNWRSAHNFPLQCVKMTLLNRAKDADEKATVAQRLKRLSSIEAKLQKHSAWMKLSQMQDIGGCRAIVENIVRLNKLIQAYKDAAAKNPKRSTPHKTNDYINEPKEDGYRSYHFVYRYRSIARKHKVFNDLKIEIQIRTRLQHAWATAVETVATFTGQPLKSGGGPEDWRRFFALMGTAIAIREKCPPVPGTPTDVDELTRELSELVDKLNVETALEAWRTSLQEIPYSGPAKPEAYLIELKPLAGTIEYIGFRKDQLQQLSAMCLEREKFIAANPQPGAQVVQVSTSSMKALRRAFPNYLLDTTVFIEALKYATAIRIKPHRGQKLG